ncbi:hypothetical protein ACWKWU_06155 [Chitinophaga lutea]
MKKIKMAVLAVALFCGAVGGYAQMKTTVNTYYAVPGTWYQDPAFRVASSNPSPNCGGAVNQWVCTFRSEESFFPGDWVPEQDIVNIVSGYSN